MLLDLNFNTKCIEIQSAVSVTQTQQMERMETADVDWSVLLNSAGFPL